MKRHMGQGMGEKELRVSCLLQLSAQELLCVISPETKICPLEFLCLLHYIRMIAELERWLCG